MLAILERLTRTNNNELASEAKLISVNGNVQSLMKHYSKDIVMFFESIFSTELNFNIYKGIYGKITRRRYDLIMSSDIPLKVWHMITFSPDEGTIHIAMKNIDSVYNALLEDVRIENNVNFQASDLIYIEPTIINIDFGIVVEWKFKDNSKLLPDYWSCEHLSDTKYRIPFNIISDLAQWYRTLFPLLKPTHNFDKVGRVLSYLDSVGIGYPGNKYLYMVSNDVNIILLCTPQQLNQIKHLTNSHENPNISLMNWYNILWLLHNKGIVSTVLDLPPVLCNVIEQYLLE